MNYVELTMSTAYREEHETALKNELLEERKLALVLDLDHTLLHTVVKYPPPGHIRMRNPTQPPSPAYRPHNPRHNVAHNQPAAVPDPRRAQSKAQNMDNVQRTPVGELARDTDGEHKHSTSDNGQHNHSLPSTSTSEGVRCEQSPSAPEIDGAATGGDSIAADGASQEEGYRPEDLDASRQQDSAGPSSAVCCDGKAVHAGHEQSDGAEGNSAQDHSDVPLADDANAGSPCVIPNNDATHQPDGSGSPRKRARKRARSAEQNGATVNKADGALDADTIKPAQQCDSANTVAAPPAECPVHTQNKAATAPAVRPGRVARGAGLWGVGPENVNDPTKTPRGEFDFSTWCTKLRPGAREMLHRLQVWILFLPSLETCYRHQHTVPAPLHIPCNASRS